MKTIKTQFGAAGERAVALYLVKRGYTIVQMNFSAKTGEIDVIARKGEVLACVEVKTRHRKTVPYGLLIPRSKQRKIARTAQWFIQSKKMYDVAVRFDVAFVTWGDGEPEIEYIPRAFFAQ